MGRREENKAHKHGALVDAGLRLFGAHGFERASIEQIAADAGIARGTFYLYFDSKESLFEAIVDGFFDPLMSIFDDVAAALERAGSPSEALVVYQVMAVRLAALGLGHRDGVLLVFREMRGQGLPGLRARERALIDRVTALTQQAQDLGLVRVDDPRLASLVILGGIERLHFEALIGELDLGDAPGLAARAAVLLSRVLGIGVGSG